MIHVHMSGYISVRKFLILQILEITSELKPKSSFLNSLHTIHYIDAPKMKLATILLSLAAIGLAMPSDNAADADTKHKVGTACPVTTRKSCSFDRRFVVSVPVEQASHIGQFTSCNSADALQIECLEGDGTGPPLTWQTVKKCQGGAKCHNAKCH
jgi:hypothetical protein